MGLSSSKTKTKTSQTVTPITPQYIKDDLQAQAGRVRDIAAQDPLSYVAPSSPLQNQAYEKAGSLLAGGSDAYNAALEQAQNAGSMTTTPVTGSTYEAPTVNANAGLGQLGNVATYQAIDPGQAAQADTVQLKQFIDDYQNPFQQQVIDTTLASYDDQAARSMAALEANAARNNAFGGSRYGVERAYTTADLARERANLDASLRSQGFNAAAALAGQDAAARNQANMFNTGQVNEYGLARTGWENQAAQFGAQARNDFSINRANIAASAAQQQAALQAQAAQQNAALAQQAAQFNTQQEADAATRALQSAALQAQIAGSQGALTNDQIALLAQLGGQQQAQTSAELTAPINLAQTVGSLQAMTPYDVLVGQQSDGTSTTKQSGSVLGAALGLGSLFSPIKI